MGSNDNHVYALDAATGGLRWKYDTGGWAQFSPAVTGRFVFLGAHGDGGYMVRALDASSGEQVWVAEMPSPPSADFAPVVIWDKVYLPGDWGEFHALEASTGKAAWSFDTGIPSDSPPTVRDGVLYLTAVNNAFAIDEETGDLIWSYGTETFPARDFPAVIADGVYYFSPNNRLYALDRRQGRTHLVLRDGQSNHHHTGDRQRRCIRGRRVSPILRPGCRHRRAALETRGRRLRTGVGHGDRRRPCTPSPATAACAPSTP